MPQLKRDGIALEYVVTGRRHGPVLLLLHALGASAAMWTPQLATLDRRFRVVRYDVRGHGRSPFALGASEPRGIDDLADDAFAVLDALGVERAHWCGLSMGGMTAMRAATIAPRRVASLVLAATSAYYPPPETWHARAEQALTHGMESLVGGVRERWFTPAFRSESTAAIEPIADAFVRTVPRAFAACCRAIGAMDQREQIAGIVAPTLVVAGAQDAGTTVEHAEVLTERIRGSDLRVLDASHLLNVEQPDEFTGLLIDHLRH